MKKVLVVAILLLCTVVPIGAIVLHERARTRDITVEILADVLRSETDIDVRLAAARALGGTENAAALVPLAESLDESDPSLQRRSIASLQQVSGRDFGNDAAAWRQFAKTGAVDKTPSIAERIGGWFR